MLGAERREAERSVRPRVLDVADAYERLLEDADRGGQDSLSRDSRTGEIRVDALADPRQGLREIAQPGKLGFVADLTPAIVVAVLLAAASVASRRLDMTEPARGYPHIAPRRWDREPLDSMKLTGIADRNAIAVDIRKAAPLPAPADAGLLVGRVAKPGQLRGGDAVARDFVAHNKRSKQTADQSGSDAHSFDWRARKRAASTFRQAIDFVTGP